MTTELAGYVVAVTAARRNGELVAQLERRGATVVLAPAIRTVPVEDDEKLRAATQACLDDPPDVVVATTAVGFRGWVEAAERWGLGASLLARLAAAELLTRGPKVTGAVRGAGLRERWSPPGETTEEVVAHLLAGGVADRRIAVQLHGDPLTDLMESLRAAGAQVVTLSPYRWERPPDLAPLHRLVEQVVRREVDCVTFTSAPAATSLLSLSHDDGHQPPLLEALRHDVLAACVGPVTAAPLERMGVPTVQPVRARLGDLVRTVAEQLPARRPRTPTAS